MNTDFGKKLRAIREERDMTLEEMAKLLGTTKQVLSRYERGDRIPKITVAASFADALGIPLEKLADAVMPAPKARKADIILSEEEKNLIMLYRNAEDVYRGIAVEMLQSHQKRSDIVSGKMG